MTRSGRRCARVATLHGELCRRHAEQLERELEGSVSAAIDGVASGRISIGDVISGAAQGLFDRWLGSTPWMREIDQAAARAQAQARARRGQPPPPRPPPGSPPRSRSSPPPPPPADDLAQKVSRAREHLGFEPQEDLTKERIEDRRRQLAKVFHPDRPGGSTLQMQRVNHAADLLIAQLARR